MQSGEGPELSQEALLIFYALYKQATDGPCVAEAPSRLHAVAYEKWKAHKALGPISSEEAMKRYVAELTQVAPGWAAAVGDRRSPPIEPKGDLDVEDFGIPADYVIVAGVAVTGLAAYWLWRRWRRMRAASAAPLVAGRTAKLLSKL